MNLTIYQEYEMRMLRVSLLVVGLCLFVTPIVLVAQNGANVDPPPPICCPRAPGLPGGEFVSPLVIQGQFTVSLGMLEAQGISRKQFVDRMSIALFPNKSADVVISTKTMVSQTSLNGPDARLGRQNPDASGQGLIAIQETMFYRIPLYGLNDSDFDGMEQLGLTDGRIQITIKFVKGASLDTNTQ
jgi:hypothetical protein